MSTKGYVYVVQDKASGLVKFGCYSSEDEIHEYIFEQIKDTFKCEFSHTYTSPATDWSLKILEALFCRFKEYHTIEGWHRINVMRAVEMVGILTGFLSGHSMYPVSQHEIAENAAAKRTLESMGYAYEGGELWKPPLGEKPDFDLLENQKQQIIDLQAENIVLKARIYDLVGGA
jgi:hypothetical protein